MPLTKINWAKYTFNPWHGCTKVSAGCDHCYAESLDRRHLHSREYHWGPGVERQVMGDHLWLQPIAWNESEANADARPRVFCASMADWADVEAPAGQREKLWELIRKTPNLDWLLLTKRPQNIRMYLPSDWGNGYNNVWMGVTCENRLSGLKRIDTLRKVAAKVRFVSFEPLLEGLGALNLDGIHWAIIGGETGASAREMEIGWMQSILHECQKSGVAAWVKQLGRRPVKDGQPVIVRNEKGHRDTKGDDPDFWPASLNNLDLRSEPLPRASGAS